MNSAGMQEVDHYRHAFRERLRADDGLADYRSSLPHGDHAALVEWGQGLSRFLWDEGWKRWGWPESEGGLGGGLAHRAVYYDELCWSGLPHAEADYVLEVLAEGTRKYAPELAAAHLGLFAGGRTLWGQGFSEPEAGSDLAALRCRAVPADGGFVVSGSKVWTSHGANATHVWTLVRTGTQESRHRGLSALLVDVDAPGVTVRPLTFASGEQELAEVAFEEVRVPSSRLVGAVGQGWEVAMYLLQFERGMYGWMRQAHLFRLLQAGLAGASTDAAAALGEAVHAVQAVRARTWATVERLAAGHAVGPEASVDKVLLARAEQLALDALRDAHFPAYELDAATATDRAHWWYTRAASIYGGSAEVQRTILADRVLHLPPEESRKDRT